jgi:hypothetical protein
LDLESCFTPRCCDYLALDIQWEFLYRPSPKKQVLIAMSVESGLAHDLDELDKQLLRSLV